MSPVKNKVLNSVHSYVEILRLKCSYMVYLDNYINKAFDEKLKKFIKSSLLDALRKCSQSPNACGDVDIFISAGSQQHWRDSIEFALRNGGYTIWGKREENKNEWINRILSQGLKGMESSFFTSYIMSGAKLGKSRDFVLSPMIVNMFYCNDVGIFGAGVVTTLIIDGLNPFWAEERSTSENIGSPVIIFPFRWLARIFWLHPSVLAHPTDPSKWRGIKPPEGIVTRGGLQRVKDNNLRYELINGLITEIMRGVDETLRFFEKPTPEKPEKREEVGGPPQVPEKCVINISTDDLARIRNEVLQEFAVEPDIVDFLLSVLVYGCKNVLLIGKPGTGKTSIAKFIAERLNFEPVVVTANAHWSRVDVVGGPMFIGTGAVAWRPGILMEALAKHLEARRSGKRGAWLIIDEINRADVDKAFGEFFTIFSGPEPSEWIIPAYVINEWERYSTGSQGDVYKNMLELFKNSLRKSSTGYYVPPDFRVIGTMNYVDVANLFAIGEAFTRRFVRVVIDYPSNLDRELDILLNKVKRIKEFDDKVMSILDKDTLSTIKALTKELRDVKRLAFGSAHLLNTLYAFLAQVKLRLVTGEPVESIKREAKRILKHAVESSLSITPLWDEELKHDVDKALDKALGPS